MKLPLVLAGEVSNNSAPLPAANPPVPLPVMIIAGDTPLPCACTSIPVVTAPPVYVIVALLPSVNVPVPLPSLITMNWKGLADVMFEVMVTFVGSTITFPVVPPALKLTRPVPEDGLKATLEPAGALKTMFAPDVVILNGVPVAGVWTVKPPLLGATEIPVPFVSVLESVVLAPRVSTGVVIVTSPAPAPLTARVPPLVMLTCVVDALPMFIAASTV